MGKSQATRQFYDWVWPHRAAVLRAAQIQTGNTAEAEDLAQETLLKAFKAIGSFSAGTNVVAWLMTILRNARIDRLRPVAGSVRQVSLQDLPADPVGPETADAVDPAAWNNAAEMLAEFADAEVIKAMGTISEDLRWTLLLVDVQGLDHSEAAKILEVPVGTVKSRVHRGHALLRAALMPMARDRRLVDD